jgi:hypothetical protein
MVGGTTGVDSTTTGAGSATIATGSSTLTVSSTFTSTDVGLCGLNKLTNA